MSGANIKSGNQRTLSNVVIATLAIAVVIVTAVASVPSWRAKLQSWVHSPYREVLAKARGDLTGKGDVISVIKVRTEEGLRVEVYERNQDSDNEKLLASLLLEERRDAHFNIRGQATNLALVDLDGDGLLEIVAPAYDENLIPRLHVYHFDPNSRSFTLMGPDSVHF